MSQIYPSACRLMGRTPLVELTNIEKAEGLTARLLAKPEARNPGGSVKDRVALAMVEDAEEKGLLSPGATIVEPTSGNTGIGLCTVAAARGYRCVIIMPDNMSRERIAIMKALGARVLLTPEAGGMAAAIEEARHLTEQLPGSWMPGQFSNPANPLAHYTTTGPEIWADTGGELDFFVAGIGTGGTVTGVGRYLKDRGSRCRIVGIEPAESPTLTASKSGRHGIPGIGPGFIPEVLDLSVIDRVIPVATADARAAARRLAQEEGILAGISSGAALHGALSLARLPENAKKTVVMLLPDSGERYLSNSVYK